jgi:hypothetical protein
MLGFRAYFLIYCLRIMITVTVYCYLLNLQFTLLFIAIVSRNGLNLSFKSKLKTLIFNVIV